MSAEQALQRSTRMERQLKERVVGAVLLVLAAVLIIPLFLDGPDPGAGEARTTVALPAAEELQPDTRTVRLEQSRDTPTAPPMRAEPVPAASPPADEAADEADTANDASDAPGETSGETSAQADSAAASQAAGVPPTEPEPATPAPVVAPAPAAPAASAPSAPPAAAPEGISWVVQLGSFGTRDNAERLAEELRGKRYQSFVTRVDADGRTLHRVRIGPGGEREAADRLLERLRADGYSGQAVPE